MKRPFIYFLLLKTKRGEEEARLFVECDQKRDQAKSRALEMYLRILSQVEHKKLKSKLFLEQLRLWPLK